MPSKVRAQQQYLRRNKFMLLIRPIKVIKLMDEIWKFVMEHVCHLYLHLRDVEDSVSIWLSVVETPRY